MLAEFDPAYFEYLLALEDTHSWTRAMRRFTFDLLRRHTGSGLRRVLDAGCGAGRFLYEWRQQGARSCFGIDISPSALQLARDRSNANLAVASAAVLPFADATFDALHCADVLQHLSIAETGAALEEFGRVLRPEGFVALRVRAPRHFRREEQRDYDHSFLPDELRRMLPRHGFDVRYVSRVNAFGSVYAEITEHRTDLATPVKYIAQRSENDLRNRLLGTYLNVERRFLLATGLSLGFGHTIICIACRSAK